MERAASTALPSCRPRLLSPSRLPPLLRLLARPLWGIWAGLLLSACGDDTEVVLRARQITEPRELIGGPAAKGKVGDFLLENDQLRAIIASEGQTWLGNAFGGSLVDADRVRPSRRDDRYGHGFDSFGETFPLVNLIISDPAKPMRRLETSEGSIEVRSRPGSVAVLADGSDGKEAVVRVQGAGGYLFQAIKFLNRDFLRVMLAEFKLAGMPLPLRDLARTVIDPNLDLFSLLNRLQLDFNFTTDYIVRPGKPYVIIRTTVELAPPSSESLAQCPALPAGCRLTAEQCPDGLALQQVDVPQPGQTEPVPLLCPVCSCAEPTVLLVPFTEQRSIFGDMLGDLDQWVQPGWRGGIVGGDFLFFGAQASIFIPGLGFDDDRRVFENMWQGIGSLASPFVYPWVAGTGENVSYAMTTVNPVEQPPASCPTHRLALLWVDPAAEEEVGAALVSGFGFTGGGSAGLVRG
ncbi:MAG: hypothetical protein FJ125_08555, partial [Deltaproteobacteria bacterium]|nr:hypothetical protein [Deltaproteobacteria bacterium]